MVDAETGDVVEGDQKGRGYELSKGKYVEIEGKELEAVQIESNHAIDIDSFVPKDEIDQRYLNHPYYIVPDGKAGLDAFTVIRDAMKDQDRVALARIVLTNREHVITIEPFGKGLLGTTLRYPYELRDAHDYFDDIKAAGKTIEAPEPEEKPGNVAPRQSLKTRGSAPHSAKSHARRSPQRRPAKRADRSAARHRQAG